MPRPGLLLAAMLMTVTGAARAAEEMPLAGNWKVLLPLQTGTQPFALLHLEEKDDRWTGKVLDPKDGQLPFTLKEVRVSKDVLHLSARLGENGLEFEMRLPPDKEGRLRGTMRSSDVQPVEMEHTTISRLTPHELNRELLSKQKEGVLVVSAALGLLSQAGREKAKPEEVRSWAARAARAAQDYGPAWHQKVLLRISEVLLEQKTFADVALSYARQAERMLTPKERLSVRKRTLELLAGALKQAGKDEEAKAVEARIGKIDFTIKPISFAGRKSESKRAVLVELFTSAQEPSCVAPELAVEALGKTFKPEEAVLLQYHLNPREGDPLSFPGAVSRVEYYRLQGLPIAFFDGQTSVLSAGGQEEAGERYESFVDLVKKLLEEPARAKIEAKPEREGDRISVKVQVSDITEDSDKLRLRVALVEQVAAYTGRNKLTHHHHVVRSFLGGEDGLAVSKGKNFSKAVSVDLSELRKQLKAHLEEVARDVPFPNKERPIDLSKLSIVAFVQDDQTRAVLQAVQAEVSAGKEEKKEEGR